MLATGGAGTGKYALIKGFRYMANPMLSPLGESSEDTQAMLTTAIKNFSIKLTFINNWPIQHTICITLVGATRCANPRKRGCVH